MFTVNKKWVRGLSTIYNIKYCKISPLWILQRITNLLLSLIPWYILYLLVYIGIYYIYWYILVYIPWYILYLFYIDFFLGGGGWGGQLIH